MSELKDCPLRQWLPPLTFETRRDTCPNRHADAELREVLADAQTSIMAALILLPKGSNGLQLLNELLPKINDALLPSRTARFNAALAKGVSHE